MKRFLCAVVFVFAVSQSGAAFSHCEIPCGIYGDEMRFEMMEEHIVTIEKSMKKIAELSGKANANQNQLVRWVVTKEAHAEKVIRTISDYFMAQKIKPGKGKKGKKKYVEMLTRHHAVMVAAMKCKQSADAATATALRAAILNFYRAYEGKEPQFHD